MPRSGQGAFPIKKAARRRLFELVHPKLAQGQLWD
jgi:hypothetical protein